MNIVVSKGMLALTIDELEKFINESATQFHDYIRNKRNDYYIVDTVNRDDLNGYIVSFSTYNKQEN